MTSTAATRNNHDHQPGRSDMNEHPRKSYLNVAFLAADQERRAVNEAAHHPWPEDLDAACQRARDAALAALAGAGLNGDEGTVTRHDPKLGQLDVRWDSGSTLSMLLNDGDRVRLITPASGTGNGKDTGR